MRPWSSAVASLCVVLLWLTGCQTLPNPWQNLPPPATVLTNVEPIWERLASRRQRFKNLKGLASVRLRTGVRSVVLDDMAVVLRDFDTLRLEGLGPFMQPLFLLIADPRQLMLYAPQDGLLLSGAASAENLLRLFGLELAPSTLQYVLVGDVPFPTLPTGGRFAYVTRDNLYVWQGTLQPESRHARIWFEPYDWRPVRFEIEEPPGHLILQGWYEEFLQVDDTSVPSRITLSQPDTGRRLIWHYRDVYINPGVTPALFHLRVPPGTAQRAIEDLPAPDTDTLPRLW